MIGISQQLNMTVLSAVAQPNECIEVTGEKTGEITGDLTINGVTKSIVLDAEMTQMGDHPMANKPWVGFNATTTVVRSEFDMGQFAPYVSDEVEVFISIEAMKAE